jgi:hypothetical protein
MANQQFLRGELTQFLFDLPPPHRDAEGDGTRHERRLRSRAPCRPQEIPSEPLFDRAEMAGEGAELSPEARNPSRSMLAIARDSVAEADFFPECLRALRLGAA